MRSDERHSPSLGGGTGAHVPNSSSLPGEDVRVSGRANTPSWVYRRRLTGRLWNTAICLTAAPLTHSHAQLGIPETAHGPTLEYRHLSHGCSTHHDAVHGGRQDEKLAIANAVMATLQAKREELARNPNAESAAEIKKAMDRHVNSVRENRVRALTSNPSLSAAGEGGSCSPRHPSPMAIWCHGSDRRVEGLVSFRVKARVSLNPGLPANLLQHQ